MVSLPPAEASTVHRVTGHCCSLLVVAFCALSVSSTVAADEIAALREKAEKGDAKPQASLGEKYAFGIAVILCEGITPRIES